MKNHLGIFFNNTNTDLKFHINLNNFNNLKKNFDNIIIVDINNEFSKKLRKKIINKKDDDYKYDEDDELDTEEENKNIFENKKSRVKKYFLDNLFLKKDTEDYNFNDIIYILENINYIDYNYITFINDDYIYCNTLTEYFKYVHNHNLDLCSFSDSTENKYHYQLYIFTISSVSVDSFINLINTKKDYKKILFRLHTIIENKMPYLKIGFLNDNINNNIFYNNNIYKYFFEEKILPIININYLFYLKNNYKYIIHDTIPDDFDINIYKSSKDLEKFPDDFLYEHFLNYGQFEFRKYNNLNNSNYVLPYYLRSALKKYNLLHFFDIPDDFNIYKYRENNADLQSFDENKLVLHWLNYGYNELRIYK
jgi:hypothetical protein